MPTLIPAPVSPPRKSSYLSSPTSARSSASRSFGFWQGGHAVHERLTGGGLRVDRAVAVAERAGCRRRQAARVADAGTEPALHDVEEGPVGEPGVIAVHAVLELQLPVRGHGDAVCLVVRDQRQPEALVEEAVDVADGPGPEVVRQRRHGGVEGGEDEPAVALHPGQGDQAEAVPDIGGLPFRVGHADQLPVVAVGPAVVLAAEGLGVARGALAHHRAAVPAPVDEHPDLAVLAPYEHDRLGADPHRQVVAGGRQLALVGHEDPGPLEDPLHLEREHGRIAIDLPPNPVIADECSGISASRRHH